MTVNHDGVITHLAPDTLESEVKWVLESITMNKASGGDGIPVQFSSVAQSSQTLCDPMKCSMTGRPPCPSPSPGVYPNPCPLSQ